MSTFPTIRKLRRITVGANDSGYFVMPPRNWMDITEQKEGKKILHFALRTEGENLVLSPVFSTPKVESSRNASPNDVLTMLKDGSLTSKLREVHKGKNVYRVIKIPRVWVHAKEQYRRRRMSALRLTAQPETIVVEPIYGEKLKQS